MYKKYFKDKSFKGKDLLISLKVNSVTKVLLYKDIRLVIRTENIQSKIVQWYHHYLQHPGKNQLEETIVAIVWWQRMRPQIREHVKTCVCCQCGKCRNCNYRHRRQELRQSHQRFRQSLLGRPSYHPAVG